MNSGIAYSIVIPTYNGADTLGPLYQRLTEVLCDLGRPFEIIFVDDCSPDMTWPILQALAQSDVRVQALQLIANSGQGVATLAGLRRARGQFVVTMDDDLQNPPEEVPRLLFFLDGHAEIDVVFGKPRKAQQNWWRRAGSRFINKINNYLFQQDSALTLTSFRAIRRDVLAPLLALNVPSPAVGALLTTITRRVTNIEVEHHRRRSGHSGYTLAKLLGVTLDKFLGFSTLPLRFLAVIGILGVLGSGLLGSFTLARYLLGQITVPGWATLTLILIGLSGFMFMAFGIVGEYLQQILMTVRGYASHNLRQAHTSSETDVIDAVAKKPCNPEGHKHASL